MNMLYPVDVKLSIKHEHVGTVTMYCTVMHHGSWKSGKRPSLCPGKVAVFYSIGRSAPYWLQCDFCLLRDLITDD